jgi:hypothetical protein
LPGCCPVPPRRRQLARRQPIANAVVPPIKPIPPTMQAPEIAPFTAPPETAARRGRKVSNHPVRNRAGRLSRVEDGRGGESPVSRPRSSNRTCRFPASGFPTGFTAQLLVVVRCEHSGAA